MFLIVAISKNFIIGKDNKIPWHLPEDLKKFKQITINCAVIMGKNTYFSIGKPLINRFNIVITGNFENLNRMNRTNNEIIYKNLIFVKNAQEAIHIAYDNGFNMENIGIIGGYNIYKEFLAKQMVNKIYLTVLDKNVDGDTVFPIEYLDNFKEVSSEKYLNNKEGEFYFKELIKI